MRGLIFLSSTRIGGAERMLLTLADGLAHTGEVRLAVGRSGPLDAMAGNIERFDLNAARTRQAIRPLAGCIKSFRPDWILTTKTDACVAAALAHQFCGRIGRLVLRESNHRSAQGLGRLTPWMLALRWAYHRADHVVAPSEAVRRDVCRRNALSVKRTSRIFNPIDTDRVKALSCAEPQPVLDSDVFHLVAVGRLVRQKGFDLLICALAKVVRNRRDWQGKIRLTLVGDGPERQALESLSRQQQVNDCIHFSGAEANPYPWMRSASLFVLSSRWEGFPNALAEAMCLGVPVLATDCPAGPAEMLDGGKFGFLCPANSDVALAEAIQTILGKREQLPEMGAAASARSERFLKAVIASEYAQLFQNLCGEQHRTADAEVSGCL